MHHDLPLTVNESVLQYLSFFTTTRGRAIVEHGLDRAGRYSDMIRRVLAQEGVPQDLIYLAQAESAFQPDAVSRAGARGIWQFMAPPRRGIRSRPQLLGGRPQRPGKSHAGRGAAFPRSLRDVRRLVSGDGRLQFGPADRGAGRPAHRLRGFLGAAKAQRAAEANAELRSDHPGDGAGGQGSGALRRAGKPRKTRSRPRPFTWNIRSTCIWWPTLRARISTICGCSIRSCSAT